MTTHGRAYLLCAFTLLIGASAGCTRHQQPESAMPAPAAPMYLHVINENSLDMNVYVIRDGSWFRLGTVQTGTDHTFNVTQHAAGAFRLPIGLDPIGAAQRHVLEAAMIGPAETLEIVIQGFVAHSFWRIVRH